MHLVPYSKHTPSTDLDCRTRDEGLPYSKEYSKSVLPDGMSRFGTFETKELGPFT